MASRTRLAKGLPGSTRLEPPGHHPCSDGLLGHRQTALDPTHPGRYRQPILGDDLKTPPDAGQFGRDVADFFIGEPLGTYANGLSQDDCGIDWWD